MSDKKYLGGSRAFFEGLKGFKPHDTDLVDFNSNLSVPGVLINRPGTTIFRWGLDKAQDMIEFILKYPHPAHRVCALLVPEVVERVGMTIELLPKLKPLIDNLDYKHQYLGIIWQSYIDNNAFTLTEEQLNKAYDSYLSTRGLTREE